MRFTTPRSSRQGASSAIDDLASDYRTRGRATRAAGYRAAILCFGTKLPKLVGQSTSALPGNSDINLFCYGQGVIDLDAEVSDGAFDLGVAEQKLHGPQVAGAPVDQGGFGSSE